jgi:hypothetical protein
MVFFYFEINVLVSQNIFKRPKAVDANIISFSASSSEIGE